MGKSNDTKIETKDFRDFPASVTARVISDRGFHLLFTLRDTSGKELLNKFEEFEKVVAERGWKPDQDTRRFAAKNGNGSSSYGKTTSLTAGEKTTCAKCGAPAIRKTGIRRDSTQWEGVFCSTGEEAHKMWIS